MNDIDTTNRKYEFVYMNRAQTALRRALRDYVTLRHVDSFMRQDINSARDNVNESRRIRTTKIF